MEQYTPQQISEYFKDLFTSKSGEIVLSKIKEFCRGNVNQGIACTESTNQTFYNLGAYAVYRFILFQIEMQFNEPTKDCVINEESGE